MKRKMFLLGIVLLIVLFAGILIYLKNTEPAVVHTYKENLLFIAEEISKDVKTVELRKAMKNLEKGA